MITRFLKQAGAGEVTLAPLCGRRAAPAEAKRVLTEADLVFVSGGDVEAGMRALRATEMIGFLRELAQGGKPFFGLSAGSIMLGRQWVRWEDPDDDATAERFACLGLADLWCDTHAEAEGWEELRTLLRLSPDGSTGYGIVSGTALLAHPDGAVSALGGEVHRFQRQGQDVVQLSNLLPAAESR
jgi:cyanophycinase-like exopeptidase